jgi:DNA-binding transcriptional regulator LsrR (DeoR family)
MASDQDNSRLDDAARAGWLYFIAGNTQDEIARKLNVSRQTAQRLVSLAVSEKLVTFRLQHPIAACMELAQRLADRFGLTHCEVAPADAQSASSVLGIAELAAAFLESRLRSGQHMIVGLGTGRAMRAAVDQMPRMSCPNHQLVSLVGNIAPDGSATFFDVLSKLADLTQARHYPMPLPVFCASAEERAQLLALDPVRKVHSLAEQADLMLVGLGQVSRSAPLHQDGFISSEELFQLMRHGAVGEIASWCFDADGQVLDIATNLRTTSVPLRHRPPRPVVAVAMGEEKVSAIRAALRAQLVTGLITNETTAAALLA